MLIGPQNSTLQVNEVRSRILEAATAAGRDPAAVTLVAVSKAQTAESVRLAATAGVTDFGENYLQ
jgi:PLP dependent protein